jgi:hypothetical protein
MVRSNLLKSRNVHVKLDKETHAAFRTKLMLLDMSMQEAFAAFAQAVSVDEASAINIVKRLARRQMKEELASVGLKPSTGPKRKPQPLGVLDHELLYDLINDVEQKDDNEAA